MADNNIFLEVRDYSVTGERFQLILNEDNNLLETHPQPRTSDLSKYYVSDDYISHTDSKRNFFEHIYHIVRIIALKRKLRLINSFSTISQTILDIGCGTGDFIEIAKNNNWKVTGIEPNEQARDIANKKTEDSVYDSQKLKSLNTKSFDVISLWHVLEHLPDLANQIKIIKQLLKENGRLVVAVPNYKSYDAKYYGKFWAAFDAPRHLWHFSKNSIADLFNDFELEIEETLPMKFDAFYVSILSEKYKNAKFQFLRGLYRGWLSNFKARKSKEHSSHIYVLRHRNSNLDKI